MFMSAVWSTASNVELVPAFSEKDGPAMMYPWSTSFSALVYRARSGSSR
jgi:hypothetical protein